MYFNKLYFSSYLLKRGTLFIDINNLTSNNNKTTTNQITSSNNTMTNQMNSSNKMMTSRGTLPIDILTIDLATLVTIDIFDIVLLFYMYVLI